MDASYKRQRPVKPNGICNLHPIFESSVEKPSTSNKLKGALLLLFLMQVAAAALAQDTLPQFTLRSLGNKRIVIGWVNNYPDVRQISIQRSLDSLTGYKTILTVPDPMSRENGYVDTRAPHDRVFYRIYIQLDQGRYLFSQSRRPDRFIAAETPLTILPHPQPGGTPKIEIQPYKPRSADSLLLKEKPVVVTLLPFRFQYSNRLPDTASGPLRKKLRNPLLSFTPSAYVFTQRDGYVRVSLPETRPASRYLIRFYTEDNSLLFELKDLKAHDFRLDKANFYHAGWFRFELYEEGRLLEKHRFYLEKEF